MDCRGRGVDPVCIHRHSEGGAQGQWMGLCGGNKGPKGVIRWSGVAGHATRTRTAVV